MHGLAPLERFASIIDHFNSISTRPNPFLSSAFLLRYALHAEYHVPGREERLYIIRDGGTLIGCAPLRWSLDRYRGVRLQFLAPSETANPGILSLPEDEARVAAALVRHICDIERGWGMVEFVTQRPGSILHLAVHGVKDCRFRVRDIDVEPHNEIAIVWRDLEEYFRSLGKKMRSNLSRQARRLFNAGDARLVIAEGGQAATAWFDAYLDLNRRSWKHGTSASIERHPRRLRFYQELVAGTAGFDPEFIGVVLDGVLIAGLLVGSNATTSPVIHGAWCLEMAYDQSRADLGPGQLLLLMAVGRAIEKGHGTMGLMQNFSYFKHRWSAKPTQVLNIQLICRLSRHNLFGLLGELRRKLQQSKMFCKVACSTTDSADSSKNIPPFSASEKARSDSAGSDNAQAREFVLAAIERSGIGFRQFDSHTAYAYLPMTLE